VDTIWRPAKQSRTYRDILAIRHALMGEAESRFQNVALRQILRAMQFAEDSHRGQLRKGIKAPYAIHPMRVALLVIEQFGISDPELVCAALLHDTLEDTNTDQEVLREQFGARCADLVTVLTRGNDEGRPDTGDRIEAEYLQRIIRAGNDALLLKVIDKLDNLRDALYHPDRTRVSLFLKETFSAYIPLARKITNPLVAAKAEKLLLEAAADLDGGSPELHAALFDCLQQTISMHQQESAVWNEIPLPEVSSKLYLYLNPNAVRWLEFDNASVFPVQTSNIETAANIARGLRETVSGRDLEGFLKLAGVPRAFASAENRNLWNRVTRHLIHIQQLLRNPKRFGWFETLTEEQNSPLLLALIQSAIYLPATWRSPLWSENAGVMLSRRVCRLSGGRASNLLPAILDRRLALTRYLRGSGTFGRIESVFNLVRASSFSSAGLWSLRIAAEYLDMQGESDIEDQSNAQIRTVPELDEIWDRVKDSPFSAESLPERGPEIALAAGRMYVAEKAERVETVGLQETRIVFERAKAGGAFERLIQALLKGVETNERTTWLDFDSVEWEKRRRHWSNSEAMRVDLFEAKENSEESGVRVHRRSLPGVELWKLLPARRFALQDRLPETTKPILDSLSAKGFSAAALFDILLDRTGSEELWVPRMYRVLDSLEDLDPENVQTIIVAYEGPEPIPLLTTYLPLPGPDETADQEKRKRLIVRYLVAQIYNCAVVRCVRKVRFQCSAVADAQLKHAFTEEELKRWIAEIELDGGYRNAFANYLERYEYEPFQVVPSAARPLLPFGRREIERGFYVGIDIGAALVKVELFRDGSPIAGTARPSFPTPRDMEISEFCRAILLDCGTRLAENGVKWGELQGIGVSWPGAVRNNRLAGASGVLRGLRCGGTVFRDDDPINRLPRLDLVSLFRGELEDLVRNSHGQLDKDFAVAIHNDGDAEALGNHALRVMRGDSKKGGKIFIKLGTSVAGGRITSEGAVAEEVAEYGKIVLNLNCPPDPKWPGGTARYFASAVAVRELSRTFVFENRLLFGVRDGTNLEESKASRIEPIEVGSLLTLLGESEISEPFVAQMVEHDNHPPMNVTRAIVSAISRWLLGGGRDELLSYIRARGLNTEGRDTGFTAGLDRTIWLCTGQNSSLRRSYAEGLPGDFPFEPMAGMIVGAACLFGQLSLQLAHLIAQLYNVYRRGVFSEVVLSGGVLSGATGEFVEARTRSFLSKYYDKIYGFGRPLAPDSVTRASRNGVSNAGPFGAAMAANRMRQVSAAQSLTKAIHHRLKQCEIGEIVQLDELLLTCDSVGTPDSARDIVEAQVAAGSFLWVGADALQRIS
jgi:HD domain-containing protein